MTKTSQKIFAKGKAMALDSLFVGNDAPFGYLAVGYSEENDGFDDPIENTSISSSSNYSGFKEIDFTQYEYERVPLTLVDAADFTNINYNSSTQTVTRTYQATLETGNIKGTNINQIAIVSNDGQSEAETDFYSATTFATFYKNDQSSITFRISFTL